MVALWIMSIWWTVVWSSAWGFDVFAQGGTLGVFFFGDRLGAWGPPWGWKVNASQSPFQWWFYSQGFRALPKGFAIGWIPLWVPALLAAACSAVAWRLDALAARNVAVHPCSRCGYERAGIAKGAKCPECGAEA